MSLRKTFFNRVILFMAAAFLSVILFYGCSPADTTEVVAPEIFLSGTPEDSPGMQAGFAYRDYKYYYSTLTQKQKEIYVVLYEIVDEMKTGNIKIAEGVESVDLSVAMSAYFADNPSHFWVTESMETCWTSTDNLGMNLDRFFNGMFSVFPGVDKKEDFSNYSAAYCNMKYIYETTGERDEAKKRLETKIAQALSGVSPDMSEFDRELYLHDWLLENCEYDGEAYDEYLESGLIEGFNESYTAYGALVNGKATCAGYARAMQLLLSETGIESRFITGVRNDEEVGEAVAHAWNVVFIDGAAYHLDATWNDRDLWGIKDSAYSPVKDGNKQGFYDVKNRTEHKYFNVNEETVSRDHWGFAPQLCTATDANYYFRKGLDFTIDSTGAEKIETLSTELADMVRRNVGLIEVYVGTDQHTREQLVDTLVDKAEGIMYDSLAEANQKLGERYFREDIVYYGVDEEAGIISIYTIKNDY